MNSHEHNVPLPYGRPATPIELASAAAFRFIELHPNLTQRCLVLGTIGVDPVDRVTSARADSRGQFS
ncbi:hypothetical protein ABIE00_000284 [Arthrobacter sp. OAP107]